MSCFIRHSLASLVFVSACIAANATPAQHEVFVVKAVTLSESSDKGHYELESIIPADGTAVVTFKIPAAEVTEFVDSLTSSVPVKTVSTPGTGTAPTTVTVTASTTTAVAAKLTFIADHGGTVLYDVYTSTSKLNTYIRIKDTTYSDAKWSGTKVVLRGSRGDLPLRNTVDMDADNTVVLPLPSISNYGVVLTAQNYLRADADSAYEVVSMTNDPGGKILPKGTVRLIDNTGLLQTTVMNSDLLPGGTIDLLARKSDSTSVTRASGSGIYEALELSGSILRYRIWSGDNVTIENKSPAPRVIRIGRRSAVPVEAEGEVVEFVGSEKTITIDEIELLTIPDDVASLKGQLAKLKQIREFPSTSMYTKTQSAIAIYQQILESRLRRDVLGRSKTAAENLIVLGQANPNIQYSGEATPTELDQLQNRILFLMDVLRDENLVEPRQKLILTRVLLP